MTSPIQIFMQALPYAARRGLTFDHHSIAAIHKLADQGDDLEKRAARIGAGMTRRPRTEVQKLVKHRLMRDAGMLNDTEEDAG